MLYNSQFSISYQNSPSSFPLPDPCVSPPTPLYSGVFFFLIGIHENLFLSTIIIINSKHHSVGLSKLIPFLMTQLRIKLVSGVGPSIWSALFKRQIGGGGTNFYLSTCLHSSSTSSSSLLFLVLERKMEIEQMFRSVEERASMWECWKVAHHQRKNKATLGMLPQDRGGLGPVLLVS